MQRVYLSLGSNLGDKRKEIELAIQFLSSLGQMERSSSLYETEPLEMDSAPSFINAACCLLTSLEPLALINHFHAYDAERGRTRKTNEYISRPIDIDILVYGNYAFSTPNIVIPHAKMLERRFVLQPLDEIASDLQLPNYRLSVKEALLNCPDRSEVKRLTT